MSQLPPLYIIVRSDGAVMCSSKARNGCSFNALGKFACDNVKLFTSEMYAEGWLAGQPLPFPDGSETYEIVELQQALVVH